MTGATRESLGGLAAGKRDGRHCQSIPLAVYYRGMKSDSPTFDKIEDVPYVVQRWTGEVWRTLWRGNRAGAIRSLETLRRNPKTEPTVYRMEKDNGRE